jgi:cell division septal protein FtsQ
VSPLLPKQPIWFARIRRLLAWGLTGGLVVITTWAAGDQLAHGDTFQVTEVSFVGINQAGAGQLRHLSDIRQGTHLFKADLSRAVIGIEKHPWVAEASARRQFPSTVEIHIREYIPEMLLALDGLWYIDGSGTPFKRADTDHLDFPILTGLTRTFSTAHPAVSKRVIQQGLRIYQTLNSDTVIRPSALSEIHFEPHRGFTLVLRSGTRVRIGFTDTEPALARLLRMTQTGLDLAVPQAIDLGVGRVATATPFSK